MIWKICKKPNCEACNKICKKYAEYVKQYAEYAILPGTNNVSMSLLRTYWQADSAGTGFQVPVAKGLCLQVT